MNNTRPKTTKRYSTRWRLLLFDLCVIAVLCGVLFLAGFGGRKMSFLGVSVHFILIAVCLTASRVVFRVYRQVWRYGGVETYILLIFSDAVGCIVYFCVERFVPEIIMHFDPEFVHRVRAAGFTGFRWECVNSPAAVGICSVILLASLLCRLVYRYSYKTGRRRNIFERAVNDLLIRFIGKGGASGDDAETSKIRIAIVGAGSTGTALAEELINNKKSAYVPKFFVEINPLKAGRLIYGIPVLHASDVNADVIKAFGIQEIVFAIGQRSAEETKAVYDSYVDYGCKLKVYDFPTIESATGGKRHMREFDIEELLFRKPLDVIGSEAYGYYKDKTVMITGGGGSIGSELCRQIAKMSPAKLIIVDIYENGAYDLQQELKFQYEDELDVCVEIVSVCNRGALDAIFEKYRPQVVIHAAAHKHVPFMEHNCVEAVENNVFGTLNVADAAEKYGAECMIMVSTDKAVNPTNVMGATKRVCEMIVLSRANDGSRTNFSATRFGNVLGSAGSVIPLFKRQIAAGGPVTVTDKRIIRYFMTIPEASQLVLESGAMAKNGELFVLDMGKPVKILELAENMIRLSGLTPYTDIDIVETGLRPGEKLYEELLVKTEELDRTDNSLIFIERDQLLDEEEMTRRLDVLREAVATLDNDKVKAALKSVVETYRDPSEINPTADQSSEMKSLDKNA